LLEATIRFPFPLPRNGLELLLREYTKISTRYGVDEFEFSTTANVIVSKRLSSDLRGRDGGETFDLFYGMGYDALGEATQRDPNLGAHVPCRFTPLHQVHFVRNADDVAQIDLDAVSRAHVEACFENSFSDRGSNVVVTDVVNLVYILRSFVDGRERVGKPRLVRL
jgi:hypothetical protein